MNINIAIKHMSTGIPISISVKVIEIVEVNGMKFPLVKHNKDYSLVDPVSGYKVSETSIFPDIARNAGIKRLKAKWQLYLEKMMDAENINPELVQ